jgi:hypothetical protein
MHDRKLTQLDVNQIHTRVYDEDAEAQRVIVINGNFPNNNNESSSGSIKIETIEVPVIIKDLEIKEVDKIITIPELKIIEVQKVLQDTKTEVIRVEVPQIIIQKEVQIIEVEKPIIIREVQNVTIPEFKFPEWVKYAIGAYLLMNLGLLIKLLFK